MSVVYHLPQWCVVVLRDLVCVEHDPTAKTDRVVHTDDIVAVYGPFNEIEARRRVEHFARSHGEADDGAPIYCPVPGAPVFLQQENWVDHWAVAIKMNDVPW